MVRFSKSGEYTHLIIGLTPTNKKGLYDKAISDIKQTLLEAKRCQLPDSCAQQYYQLANTLDLSGKFDEADQAFKDMMAWNRMDRKGMTATTAAQIRDYGLFKMRRGDLAEAERLLRLALLHAKTSYVQNLAAARIFEVDLAVLLDRRGKKNEANSLLEHVIKVSDRPLLKDAIYQRAIKLLASSNSSQQAIVPVH